MWEPHPIPTATQSAQLSYLIHYLPQQTTRERALLQIQVWCISENYPAGTVPDTYPGTVDGEGARTYFNRYQFLGDADAGDESRPLGPDEARCADQTARDAMVARVVDADCQVYANFTPGMLLVASRRVRSRR